MNLLSHVLLTSLFVLVPVTLASTPSVTVPIVPESTTVNVVKTFDTEVHRLALKYGQNETLAREIIKCEGLTYKTKGNNKNYNKQGVWWSSDIGWWQINDYYHKDTALKMGFDINNEWDNLEYGFILLEEQGTAPWDASKYCWEKVI